ncbi:MAG: type II restriction endonuclease [Bacilli bacterium]|nr:type II restriction endonuclease [Bacilli bacterium]
MRRVFSEWLSSMRESIANYTYYVEFDTVYKNAEAVKVELNILNSLIGSRTIEEDFRTLLSKYPEVLRCIPILLAKRESEIFAMDDDGAFKFDFSKRNYSIDQYVSFMEKTGLFNLISKKLVSNLYDYVLGVEVGLNSNGRKNRGGHLMEDLVESFIKKAGFIEGKTYFKEMYLSDLERKAHLDLSALSNEGSTAKRFDFVVFSKGVAYAIECNFYASGGSKLNETARSYKTLALESKGIPGFKFVWFTDGIGWYSARNNLKETFDVLDSLFNIKDLEDGILESF